LLAGVYVITLYLAAAKLGKKTGAKKVAKLKEWCIIVTY